MKRVVCVLLAVMFCLALACPVLAADTFVPSISYKDNPSIVPNDDGSFGWIIDGEGEIIVKVSQECLLITPVAEAMTSTKIPEASRQTLLDVYAKLSDGTMKIPYGELDADLKDKDMVIRDLFDVTLLCDDVIKELEKGRTLVVTFDAGINPDTELTVTLYKNGKWILVPMTNNGDGTVTVELPSTGVVAFSVPVGTNLPPTQTGDNSHLVLWGVMLAVSAVALLVLLVSRRSLIKN